MQVGFKVDTSARSHKGKLMEGRFSRLWRCQNVKSSGGGYLATVENVLLILLVLVLPCSASLQTSFASQYPFINSTLHSIQSTEMWKLPFDLPTLGLTSLSFLQLLARSAECAWPDTPFTTNGRDVVSASGQNVVYAGVNWPGAADTMLPEGLQYNSVANIVTMIKGLGMNVIRLTYAIEMIDDIESNSPNQSLKNTLTNALGAENGATVLQDILNKNPSFSADMTRLEVWMRTI